MAFYLVRTEPDGTRVRLLSDEVYTTRDSALDGLAGLLEAGEVPSSTHVLVADLDAAMPVLIMPVPEAVADAIETTEPLFGDALTARADGEEALAGPAEELAAGIEPLWESSAELDAGHGGIAVEHLAPMEPVSEELGEAFGGDLVTDAGLAEALREAAGVLESEGVFPPPEESAGIGGPRAAVAEPWPWDAGDQVAEAVFAAGEEDAGEDAATADEVTAQEAVADEAGPGAWPETPIEAGPAAYVPDALEEPAVDTTDLLTVRADDEMVAAVRGEPDALPNEPAEPMSVADEGAADVADVVAEEPSVALAETVMEPVVDDMPAELPPEAFGETAPSEPEPPGYEPGSDIGELTCDDCVYVNTCPKHHETAPSECGSFQWRS